MAYREYTMSTTNPGFGDWRCGTLDTTSSELIKIRKDKCMVLRDLASLSEWAKRLFDQDKKDLYRADYIDACGVMTQAGREMLDVIMWTAHEKELVAKAQERIAEAEAEKK